MTAAVCDIVHVVNQLRPGGIETMVLDLARLSRHPTRIFSLEGNTADLVRDWPGLVPLGDRIDGFQREPRLEPALIWRLVRRLRALSPRAVFLHRLNPLFYCGIAARLAGVPTIVHVEHDVWQYADANRLKLLKWSAFLSRPRHFAVSDAIAARLREIRPKADIRVVPAGVDLDRFRIRSRDEARDRLGLPHHVHLIGSAGRLEVVKGHKVLVAAANKLPSTTHIVIVGAGGERERLVQLARDLEVAERVHFLGHRDDLEMILPALDVFCLPSLDEGLPRAILEAQSAGIPVVASDVGAVRHAVDPATGHLVAAGDPEQLAAALRAATSAPRSTGGSCRAYIQDRYSIDAMLQSYDAMLTINR